jgi:hypothetical protein
VTPTQVYIRASAEGRARSLAGKPAKMKEREVTRLCQGDNLRGVCLYESNRKNDSATDRCYGRVQRRKLRHRTSFSESFVDGCARVYENRGYVAVQRLTPEERANLGCRGLLPKD